MPARKPQAKKVREGSSSEEPARSRPAGFTLSEFAERVGLSQWKAHRQQPRTPKGDAQSAAERESMVRRLKDPDYEVSGFARGAHERTKIDKDLLDRLAMDIGGSTIGRQRRSPYADPSRPLPVFFHGVRVRIVGPVAANETAPSVVDAPVLEVEQIPEGWFPARTAGTLLRIHLAFREHNKEMSDARTPEARIGPNSLEFEMLDVLRAKTVVKDNSDPERKRVQKPLLLYRKRAGWPVGSRSTPRG